MTETVQIAYLPLDRIHGAALQMRGRIDPEGLNTLVESLKRDGQQRPIKVRPVGDRYEIVFGHRTVAAARRDGWETIQAVVVELGDEAVMWAQYAENEYREDVSDYDRARWLRNMIDKFGYNRQQLSLKLDKTESRISQVLSILVLEKNVNPDLLSKLTLKQFQAILSAPEDLLSEVCSEVEKHYEVKGDLPTAKVISSIVQSLRFYSEIEEAEVMVPAGTPELLPSNALESEADSIGSTEAPATLSEETAVSKLLDEVPEIPEADAEIDPKLSPEEYIEDYFKRHPLDTETSRAVLRWDLKDKYGIPNEQARKLIVYEYTMNRGRT